MIKHTLFLKWWLFFTIVIVASIFAFTRGLVHTVWENDVTKLSFLLFGVLAFMSVWCGYKTWQMSKIVDSEEPKKGLVEHIQHLTEIGWFTRDLCLTVGMGGTVIGFIIDALWICQSRHIGNRHSSGSYQRVGDWYVYGTVYHSSRTDL